MRKAYILIFVMALLLAAPGLQAARAASQSSDEAKSFAVTPFTVNGPDKYRYLGEGVQDMLLSRLHWKDRLHPVDKNDLRDLSTPASAEEADALIGKLGVDYLVSGALTIMGDDASLDVNVRGADGQSWPHSRSTTVGDLIPALENVAGAINADIFGRPDLGPTAQAASTERVKALNPGLMYNEDREREVYLNPEFRYAGSDAEAGRLRSQRLPFAAVALTVVDADNDGAEELVLLGEHSVHIYRFEGPGALKELASWEGSYTVDNLKVVAKDLNADGYAEIMVSAVDSQEDARSYVLNYKDGKLVRTMDRIRFYLNLVKQPPMYQPVLVGQKEGRDEYFSRAGVFELTKAGDEFVEGRRVDVPGGNVFNFTYLPDGADYKIVVLDESERLKVYSSTGSLLAETDEKYSGSSVGIPEPDSFGGTAGDEAKDQYYLPLPMLPVDLDQDGKYELVVNRPISMAAQFFERYRFFPQGEIHSLFWDGVGMNLKWKTRRIKGSVTDFAIADANNDGMLDLVVCVNTHPGAVGFADRKTVVLIYPLDLSAQEEIAPQTEVEPGKGTIN